jgi:ribosomal protein S27AE
VILYEDRHRQFLLALTRAPLSLSALPRAPLSVPTEPHFILTKGQGAVVAKEQWLRLQLAYCHLAELRVTVHQRDSSSVNNGKVHLHRRKCSRCLLYCYSLSFILTNGQGAVAAKEQWLRLQLAYCGLAEFGVTVHQRDSSSVNNGKVHLHRRKCSPCLLYYSSLSFILTKGRGAAAAEERRRRLLHCSFGRIRSHLRAEVKKTPTTKVSFVYLIFQI